MLDAAREGVPRRDLDDVLGAATASSPATQVQLGQAALLAERARWVARRGLAPAAARRFEPEGATCCELPFADDRELVMDILRVRADVEVLAPAALRKAVARELRAEAAGRYG